MLALDVSQKESRCKTVHSPPAAPSEYGPWSTGTNRAGKDAEMFRPFDDRLTSSEEEEEDISEGGKQGTRLFRHKDYNMHVVWFSRLFCICFLRLRTK